MSEAYLKKLANYFNRLPKSVRLRISDKKYYNRIINFFLQFVSQNLFKTFARRLFSDFSKLVQHTKLDKMVSKHHVKGYEEFTKLVEDLETQSEVIHVLFSGGKEENGESWCPYCVTAEPVIEEALSTAPESSHFIHVEVGERP